MPYFLAISAPPLLLLLLLLHCAEQSVFGVSAIVTWKKAPCRTWYSLSVKRNSPKSVKVAQKLSSVRKFEWQAWNLVARCVLKNLRPRKGTTTQNQISTLFASSTKGLCTILKNSEKVFIDGGMCIFVITSDSVRCGILANAQMKCLKVIKKLKLEMSKVRNYCILFASLPWYLL